MRQSKPDCTRGGFEGYNYKKIYCEPIKSFATTTSRVSTSDEAVCGAPAVDEQLRQCTSQLRIR